MVKVQGTQNDTWQGTVSWLDGGKQEHFRSALELIQLISSTMEEEEKGQEEKQT